MRVCRSIVFSALFIVLLGCGKSRQLAALLPDAPAGWSVEGGATNKDVSGVGHSSAKSYTPANSALGVQRITVQILLAEKSANRQSVQSLAIEREGQFKERKEIGGFPAYESFPLPGENTHSIDLLPKDGTFVSIVAYKGGPGWDNSENRKAAVSAFVNKIDLKKIAAVE